jgi:uncharacterized protein (DUF1800 family)
MDEIAEIKKAYKEATKVKEVKELAETQNRIIEKLRAENEELKAQLAALRQNKLPKTSGKVSTEELICIEQIELLRAKSLGRELTLEEAKKLDLFVKNLRLAREQATQVIDTVDYQNLSQEELENIAQSE